MMENNPWWPRRGPAHTVPPHPSENTSWREDWITNVADNIASVDSHYINVIGPEGTVAAQIIRKALPELFTSLISQLEGMRRIERYPLAARIVVDEKSINFNEGVSAAQDLIRTKYL